MVMQLIAESARSQIHPVLATATDSFSAVSAQIDSLYPKHAVNISIYAQQPHPCGWGLWQSESICPL